MKKILRSALSLGAPSEGGPKRLLRPKRSALSNEVDLYACGGDRGDLDDERVIVVVDDDVDTRQTDHLVKLVAPLIDQAVAWHEDTYVISRILYMLWEVTSDMCEVTLREVGIYLLRDVEYFLIFGSHSVIYFRSLQR